MGFRPHHVFASNTCPQLGHLKCPLLSPGSDKLVPHPGQGAIFLVGSSQLPNIQLTTSLPSANKRLTTKAPNQSWNMTCHTSRTDTPKVFFIAGSSRIRAPKTGNQIIALTIIHVAPTGYFFIKRNVLFHASGLQSVENSL